MKTKSIQKPEQAESKLESPVTKDLFVNVYGYDHVKKELNMIKSWIKNDEYLNNDLIMLPKAIVFYGRCGTGKTLLLREYANSFNAPIFIINGESENPCKEIADQFKKARKEKFAVILVDEIDLLIDKSSRVERVFQQELDGINTKGRILVLATTNNINSLSSALTRAGRFDRIIHIDYPDLESRKEIFKQFIQKLGINDSYVDYNHIANVAARCTGADIKSICNDVYLRCGTTITTDDLEKSYRRIIRNDFRDDKKMFRDYRVAIHEAGHILMALRFKENWTFYSANFNATGGITEIHEANEQVDTIQKREENIKIAISGYLAEEAIYKKHDVGSWSDYNDAQNQIERLIERVCFKGVKYLVPDYYMEGDSHWTKKKQIETFKLSRKLLKKYARQTKRYLKSHKDQLKNIADTLYNKGECTYKDFLELQLN